MRFKVTLYTTKSTSTIPINYSYPLSAAIYRILAQADSDYASFLHEKGYGKGFKLFSFSQLNCQFNINGDRLHLLGDKLWFYISFHLPQVAEHFIKGLFQSKLVNIADTKSKASFTIQSVETVPNPLRAYKGNEMLSIMLEPLSPIVAGLQNPKGYYDFLSPEDERFARSIVHNWREKIKSCYDEASAQSALLIAEIILKKMQPKSRLITIKPGTDAETKIRGWMNFGLKLTAEKRFLELLLNAGAGLYNAQGMGCLGEVENEATGFPAQQE
jgi:CRISPR-associated endoribonuclease Cas6